MRRTFSALRGGEQKKTWKKPGFCKTKEAYEDAYSDANLIADILTTPASGGGNATSEHFQTGTKDFLTTFILHCLCSDWKNKSLPGCREFLALSDPTDPNNKKYIYDLMINSDHGDEIIHLE
ncbi:MAG: hypothetical protein LBQ89_02755 [Treponema sp.]|nr:hypothetical protein [Treponema sp.]